VAEQRLAAAISTYGSAVSRKLTATVASGDPEDQIRAPLEALLTALSAAVGLDPSRVTLIGETRLNDLRTRPDYAVSYDNVLIGFVEVKAPGKGADPRRFRDAHDKDQWAKLSALPNLLYTDGQSFGVVHSGEMQGAVQHLIGDIESAGSALSAPLGFAALLAEFLTWAPQAPRTPKELADTSARVCRLARDQVLEQLDRRDTDLPNLAADWRELLFPHATDAEFADGYVQTVTFGLLLARSRNISLDGGLDRAAAELGVDHSLIGAALRALTSTSLSQNVLSTAVSALTRVLGVVDWSVLTRRDPEIWLYFYEEFLAHYDPKLRQRTGSYYTPVEVADAMSGLVDEALEHHLGLAGGLTDDSVTVIDPAVGTGTFLRSVLRRMAVRIEQDLGLGAVGPEMNAALRRLIGFELQLGPFAVAQLQMLAELVELKAALPGPGDLRMYATNTLDNPYEADSRLGAWYEPIARSRREANTIKRDEPVVVVLGNPPYKDKSRHLGGWVEAGVPPGDPPLLDDFIPPTNWGVGAHVKHLYNPYVYFWRWATWKVFEHHQSTGHDKGVVCFITVAGFLDGPGFQRMRHYLRATSDAIYVIDCSPDGHQPPVSTRIFQGVQQPVCIVIAVRNGDTTADEPAEVKVRALPVGNREDKFVALAGIGLTDAGWEHAATGWRGTFLPASSATWSSYPHLDDLLGYSGSGTMPGRTWVIAPDQDTLRQRWNTLTQARPADKPEMLSEHKTDRRVDTVLSDNLPGYPPTNTPIGAEAGACPTPERIGFRSFDRQWIIPDKRLINRPNPSLWSVRSPHQVFLTAPHDTPITHGPAVTFSGLIPDLHHFHGRGGRAYPLWMDAGGVSTNVVPGLLELLSTRFDRPVTAPDLLAYIAGICAHPGYTERFSDDLQEPGVRVPLTADADLFAAAADLGHTVIWLHTYGTRYTDPSAGRPAKAPRMASGTGPTVTTTIPTTPDGMPDTLAYDATAQRLKVGSGAIDHVTPGMWSYDISGVNVLTKWFSYRRRHRDRPVMGDRRVSPLMDIQSQTWRPEYTSELIDLLHVLGLLERQEVTQADTLEAIASGPLITTGDLAANGVLPVPATARKKPSTAKAPPADPTFDDL